MAHVYRNRSVEGEREGGDRGGGGRGRKRQGTPSYLKLLSVVREDNGQVISRRKLWREGEKKCLCSTNAGFCGWGPVNYADETLARGREKGSSVCFKHVRGRTCMSNGEGESERSQENDPVFDKRQVEGEG